MARPGSSIADDPLLLVLRDGARRMLQRVIEAEVEAFLCGARRARPRARRAVHNVDALEREAQSGIASITVRQPKPRDRGDGTDGEPVHFTSEVLRPFLRQIWKVEDQLNRCVT